jgi:hypothetical protein
VKAVQQLVLQTGQITAGGEFTLNIPAAAELLTGVFVAGKDNQPALMLALLTDADQILVARRFVILQAGQPVRVIGALRHLFSPSLATPQGLALWHVFEVNAVNGVPQQGPGLHIGGGDQ